MGKDFLLLPMGDKKIKDVTNAVNNPKCGKILDYITANGKATESKLAKDLNMPISTIHYNLKQLVKAGLVISDEYHYSDKGREVSHYKMANKYIIITPKDTRGIKQKLASILPAVMISVVAGIVMKLWYAKEATENFMEAPMLAKAAPEAMNSQDTVFGAAREIVPHATGVPDIALWFIGGVIFFTLVFFIWNYTLFFLKKE